MLYPKEDKLKRVLLYACRNCEHVEQAMVREKDSDGREYSNPGAWRTYRNEIAQRPA